MKFLLTNPLPSKLPQSSFMFHSFNSNVECFLVRDVVPSNGPYFTISADQIFYGIYGVGKADIVKRKHVCDQPECLQVFTIHWLGLILLEHVWQEKLEREERQKTVSLQLHTVSYTGATTFHVRHCRIKTSKSLSDLIIWEEDNNKT